MIIRLPHFYHVILFIVFAGICSCKSGSVNLFKPSSPHEQYLRKLQNAGIDQTAMGKAWLTASQLSIENAHPINLPFRETGYFSSEKTPAVAFKFKATKGQKLSITLNKKTAVPNTIYLDLWQLTAENTTKLVASADTLGNPVAVEINNTGEYLIRLQPELLSSVEYTIDIVAGPSLSFPTRTGRNQIKSYYGDGRDENRRKHEGIDIFGTFRSPVIAASNGMVNRVNENNLGGKVVWLRPEGKDYTLYYAHLDQQIATEGQIVSVGDTLGLMGNTGNAKTTPTHLHFGIYAPSGAVDPLPFLAPAVYPANIAVSTGNLNKTLRTKNSAKLYSSPETNATVVRSLPASTILTASAATANWYRVDLPDGKSGFVKGTELTTVSNPLRKITVNTEQTFLYDKPEPTALVKLTLKTGERINLLGNFEQYQLVESGDSETGWMLKLR